MMAHYRKIVVIDAGAYDVGPLLERVEPYAEELGLPVSTIPGDLQWIRELLDGSQDRSKFLVVPPGDSVTFEDSMRAGRQA